MGPFGRLPRASSFRSCVLVRTGGHIVLVGSGAFAGSVAVALAARPSPVRVTVLARGLAAATALALTCGVRAATDGTGVTFAAAELPGEPGATPAVLAALRPDVLVCCASDHSPYERLARPSAWTDLVARSGFGVTLPLQAGLVSTLARSLAAACPDAVLVNGCLPDVVNPLLASLGLPVLCGIGNVATLAACLRAATGPADLAVLGHHAQLAETGVEVRAWVGGAPVSGVTELLRPYRALPRRELNAVGGHAAARLLVALTDGTELGTSLPGPGGLPGGYPVRVAGRRIEPDLPAGVDLAEAVAWNLLAGAPDGVEVSGGRVRHSARTASALADHLPELADGWPVDALDEAGHRLRALRRRLRTTSTTSTEEGPACSPRPAAPARSPAT